MSKTCELNCKSEGPPGPIWCRNCGHDPVCCTCDDVTSGITGGAAQITHLRPYQGPYTTRLTVGQLLNILKTATESEQNAFAEWFWSLPLPKGVCNGVVDTTTLVETNPPISFQEFADATDGEETNPDHTLPDPDYQV